MSGGNRRSGRRLGGVLVVAVLVVLAGCSGAGGGGASGDATHLEATRAAGGATKVPPSGGSGGSSSAAIAEISQRQVIKTGRVVLTVDDYGRARRNLTRAARGMNGFVSDATRRRHDVQGGTYTTGSVTLRVPDERFDAMMDRAESTGTVQHSETTSKDVTDRLVDIGARLKNLRSQRERLRTLYARANDTEDVLAVQRRLSDTQERIERLEAKQRTLQRKVTYSTIRVELREERPEPGPRAVQQWYDAPLLGAFLESVHGVTVVARALAVLVAYALPYALVFLGPLALVAGLAVRRYRRRSDDGDGGALAAEATGEEGAASDAPGTDADESGDEGDASAPTGGESPDADADDGSGSGADGSDEVANDEGDADADADDER